jgi:hypothetical protein
MTSEADLQVQVADYLRLQYPSVMFHSDFGSGIKLTMGQAIKQKRQNGGRRAWPDMFIAEPRGVKASCKVLQPGDSVIKEAQFIEQKYGLFLELKKAGTRIFKKDGTLVANEHIREQFDLLEQLRHKGYVAEFACGFDEAIRIIDEYLGGK